MIEWVEPYDSEADTTLICRMTKEDAIKAQRRSGELKNHIYKSDEDALYDFMVIHWAKEINE